MKKVLAGLLSFLILFSAHSQTGKKVVVKVVSPTNSSPGFLSNSEYTYNSWPVSPVTGVTLVPKKIVSRSLLGMTTPIENIIFQPHFLFSSIAIGDVNWGSTTINYLGLNALTPHATNTVTATSHVYQSSITTLTKRETTRRVTYTGTSTAGSSTGLRGVNRGLWRGNATGQGGFFFAVKFCVPALPTSGIFFSGVCQTVGEMTATTNPSTILNIAGVAKDNTDANLQIMFNGASGTAVKTDTGIPINNETAYIVIVYCKPNDTYMYVGLIDLDTKYIFETFNNTDARLPVNTSGLTYQISAGNNAAATAPAISFSKIYIDTID